MERRGEERREGRREVGGIIKCMFKHLIHIKSISKEKHSYVTVSSYEVSFTGSVNNTCTLLIQ